jgi:hypothetical protein
MNNANIVNANELCTSSFFFHNYLGRLKALCAIGTHKNKNVTLLNIYYYFMMLIIFNMIPDRCYEIKSHPTPQTKGGSNGKA